MLWCRAGGGGGPAVLGGGWNSCRAVLCASPRLRDPGAVSLMESIDSKSEKPVSVIWGKQWGTPAASWWGWGLHWAAPPQTLSSPTLTPVCPQGAS